MIKLIEFALPRDKGIKKIDAYGESLIRHIIKCCVYRNTTNNLAHWVNDEIAQYLYAIGAITIKCGKNNKLSKDIYKQTVFIGNCEELHDMKVQITDFFLTDVKRKQNYPEFEITPNLIECTFNVFIDICDSVCDKFTETTEYSAEYYSGLVWSILSKYDITI